MKQDDLIVLLFKIVLAADEAAILGFILVYTLLARWWAGAIGRTIVIKDILLALAFLPAILSLYFNFSRATSHVAAWTDIGLFAAIAVVMTWRSIVWIRIHRQKQPDTPGQEAPPQ